MHNILGDATQQDENQSPGVSKSKYLSVCFMEVYNETVFDLLAPTRVPLEVKAGKGGGKVLQNSNVPRSGHLKASF